MRTRHTANTSFLVVNCLPVQTAQADSMIGVAGNRRRGKPLLMKIPDGIFISKQRRMPERSLAERNLHRVPVYNCA